ncbi:MAG: DUF6281 family protein [Actinomycetota bacterium]
MEPDEMLRSALHRRADREQIHPDAWMRFVQGSQARRSRRVQAGRLVGGALAVVVGLGVWIARDEPVARRVHVPSASSASCIEVALFDGVTYDMYHAYTIPEPGERLGQAKRPGCPSPEDPNPEAFTFDIARLPGVDPSVAFVHMEIPELIFVRLEDGKRPAEVEQYLHPPTCVASDEPIEMSGPWLGILGADGDTEVDLVPPYDVRLQVVHASSSKYFRGLIWVRVPPALGQPLTRSDLRTSLWEGGDLTVTAVCDGELFVATSVVASPPT